MKLVLGLKLEPMLKRVLQSRVRVPRILSMTAVRVQPTQQTQQSYLVVMGESKIEVARVAATLSHHRHPPPPC